MNLDEFKKELLKNPKFRKEYKKKDIAFEIGMKIFEERIKKGMTQAKLAKKIGTKQSSISRLENGKSLPSLRFLEKIAIILKMDLRVDFESNQNDRRTEYKEIKLNTIQKDQYIDSEMSRKQPCADMKINSRDSLQILSRLSNSGVINC